MSGDKTQTVIFCKCKNKSKDKGDYSYERAARRVAKSTGRVFYACTLNKQQGGCGYFRWEDDVVDEYEEDSFCVKE